MACPYCLEKSQIHDLSSALHISHAIHLGEINGNGCVGTDLYQCGDCKNYWYVETEEFINLKISGRLVAPAIASMVQSKIRPDTSYLLQFYKAQGYREQAAMRILFSEIQF